MRRRPIDKQRQHAGDESTYVQAGGDVTLHTGMSVAEVRQVALDVFHAELQGPLTQLLASGAMPADAIKAELVARVPESAELFDVWENSPLKNLTLTSVGLALGHGYWRRLLDPRELRPMPPSLDQWAAEARRRTPPDD